MARSLQSSPAAKAKERRAGEAPSLPGPPGHEGLYVFSGGPWNLVETRFSSGAGRGEGYLCCSHAGTGRCIRCLSAEPVSQNVGSPPSEGLGEHAAAKRKDDFVVYRPPLPTCCGYRSSGEKETQFLPATHTAGLCQRLEKGLGCVAKREISDQDDNFHLAA